MTPNTRLGRVLLIFAYSTPILAVAIYIAVALAGPIPLLGQSEGSSGHDHSDDQLFEGPSALYEAGPGTQVGTHAPYFEIEPADRKLVTLTDLLEAEKSTFLYFWAPT